ncbi:MAG: hypothetical protein FJ096_04960 [Deltaproteobacteria bacterium]|nr:hypothetical protein [Deltaproteobacteria bacterium]
MARNLRVVCYAVNGGGVGHLTRLVAIARWLRRYALHAGVSPEIVFLTSSEADGLLFHERFASFKVPSKTAAFESGLDKLAYLALAKQWIWHSLGLLRPDLFVVDTFPRGSFGELGGCLDLCRKRAFVYRPMKRELAERAEFQAYLPLYDVLLVPDERAALPVPPQVEPRVRRVGTIVSRERVECATRADARRALELPAEAFVVWISAGGGGDPGAEEDLSTIVRALLALPDVHLVVAAGPLYRGTPILGSRVRTLTTLGASEWLAAADVAVSGAGYNSVAELMLAGIPAVLVPQAKVADEQDLRARLAVDEGAAVSLMRPLDERAVRDAVLAFMDPGARERASARARGLFNEDGARVAARELGRLVLPASEVDAAEEAMTGSVLAAARRAGVGEGVLVDAMRMLAADEVGIPSFGAAEESEAAVSLVLELHARGHDVEACVRVASAFLRRNGAGTTGVRAAAAMRVIEALAPFDDWNGAAALLRATPPPRGVDARVAAEELARLSNDLRGRGEDLYRGIARLVGRAPSTTQGSAEPEETP